jgi:DNA-binding NtrC family response regulator
MDNFRNTDTAHHPTGAGFDGEMVSAQSIAGDNANTILLVDDDTALRALTGSYLEKKGYNVVSCSNAELAANVVKSSAKIDLLITDVDMPQRSGMDLGLEMKHLRPAVPVLLISGGFLTGQSADKVREHGFNRLDKPFRLPDLLNSVHSLLDKTPEA